MKMNSTIWPDIRKAIIFVLYFTAPALIFLGCQGLLNLLLDAVLDFALARDDTHAVSSCVFLPIVVYMFARESDLTPSRKRMDRVSFFFVLLGGLALLLLNPGITRICFLHIMGFCIAGPIIEEIVYRGFVYDRARSCMRDWQAVLFSAMLFAAGHDSPSAAALAFLAGVFFAVALDRTRTLLAPIFLHIIWNLINLSS